MVLSSCWPSLCCTPTWFFRLAGRVSADGLSHMPARAMHLYIRLQNRHLIAMISTSRRPTASSGGHMQADLGAGRRSWGQRVLDGGVVAGDLGPQGFDVGVNGPAAVLHEAPLRVRQPLRRDCVQVLGLLAQSGTGSTPPLSSPPASHPPPTDPTATTHLQRVQEADQLSELVEVGLRVAGSVYSSSGTISYSSTHSSPP